MDSSSPSSPQQTSTTTGSSTAPVASSTPTTSSNGSYTEQSLSANEQFDQTTGHMGGWIGELDHPDQFSLSKS
ncbi:hypothetical protein N7449_009201 [Penicillium cf. viridicatum]|uniref:Uncharacterized protein n=1 Tax=Penicillium cf. viridicatum TaxID=2972119 RepID=A0A9W9M8U8_9EURO|nr:hypothetical protein N7449_009201 [Penicillium cf. viridicatum]